MPRVQITVYGGHLGDVEVARESPVEVYDTDGGRDALDSLLDAAMAQVRDAYGIGTDYSRQVPVR